MPTRFYNNNEISGLASALVDSQVDLNPHQVEAALFACRNPLSRGVILADEVGLELYGLVSMIDERVFGDTDTFRTQFSGVRTEQSNRALRARLSPLCKRTLRRQGQQYVGSAKSGRKSSDSRTTDMFGDGGDA